jgi:Domain of unknown function (DUF5671)
MSDCAALRAFVNAAKEQGATDEFLVALLRDKGWPAKDVYAVFAEQYAEQTGIVLPEPPGRLEAAREAFFHLLAFVTLGTWIFAIGSIWFDLIAAWAPDPTVDRFDGFVIGRISRQLASIIVGFPVFLWATRSILRDQRENPDKAESAVRRWVSNVGLLLTALVFLIDLIAFVTVLLEGEITIRFALRCFVVIVLAGAVFLYYSRGLGKSRTLPPITWHRMFAGCAGLIMALTLGLGFWSTGSPSSMRILNEDNRRVRDLYDLTVQIENKRYGGGLQGPPATLADVALTASDAFTGQPYEYRRLDAERYQVCAEFKAPSPKASGTGLFWAHAAGRKCFDISFGRNPPYPPNYFR